MKAYLALMCRCLIISLFFASIGLLSNLATGNPLPWVYVRPMEVVLAGVKVELISEREALRFLDNPGAVFIDSRNCSDYLKSHVRGAICLPPDDVEQRFPSVEPLIPKDYRVILYCYGPECDMAEKVATFLGEMGYKNMMIMSSGFPAWDKAKYPVEDSTSKNSDPSDFARSFEVGEFLVAIGAHFQVFFRLVQG